MTPSLRRSKRHGKGKELWDVKIVKFIECSKCVCLCSTWVTDPVPCQWAVVVCSRAKSRLKDWLDMAALRDEISSKVSHVVPFPGARSSQNPCHVWFWKRQEEVWSASRPTCHSSKHCVQSLGTFDWNLWSTLEQTESSEWFRQVGYKKETTPLRFPYLDLPHIGPVMCYELNHNWSWWNFGHLFRGHRKRAREIYIIDRKVKLVKNKKYRLLCFR